MYLPTEAQQEIKERFGSFTMNLKFFPWAADFDWLDSQETGISEA